MVKGKFYMVGIIHRDEGAKDRLKRILEHTSPDIITIEFTNFGLNFRKKNLPIMRKKLQPLLKNSIDNRNAERILDFFKIPYEYRVASNYAKKNKIPLYLVDMDFFSYFYLRYAHDLLESIESQEMGKAYETLLPVEAQKRAAQIHLFKNVKVFGYSNEMRVRDEYAFRLIKRIIEENPGKKIVHICGWQHLTDEYGFFSRLEPQKIYIYDKAIRF